MVRTTETAVRQIISTTLTSDQIIAFIEDASLWVTEELANNAQFIFTTSRLEIIERYLACALVRIRDLGLTNGTIGDVTEQYQVDPNITDYLLRAAAFDPTGTLRIQFMPKTERRPIKFRVGTGFREDSGESEL